MKKKIMRKVWSLLLAVVMMVSLIPESFYAATIETIDINIDMAELTEEMPNGYLPKWPSLDGITVTAGSVSSDDMSATVEWFVLLKADATLTESMRAYYRTNYGYMGDAAVAQMIEEAEDRLAACINEDNGWIQISSIKGMGATDADLDEITQGKYKFWVSIYLWEDIYSTNYTVTSNLRVPMTHEREVENNIKVYFELGTLSDIANMVNPQVPVIDNEPVNVAKKAGEPATFTVEATGATSYQWQIKDGETYTDIPNAIAATYETTVAGACGSVSTYRCVVSNEAGDTYSADATLTVKHTLTEVPAKDPTCAEPGCYKHYMCTIDGCGALFDDEEGNTPTSEEDETIAVIDHSWADAWLKDATNHWHKCNNCIATKDTAAHVDVNADNKCDVCEYVMHEHALTEVPAKVATCTEDGNNKYYKCACGKFFKADGTTETTVAAETIAATGHTVVKVSAKAATCTTDGNKEHYKCSADNCDALFKDAEGKTATTLAEVKIAALGHDMSAATCEKASECKRTGCDHTSGKALGHDMIKATCTEDGKCKRTGCDHVEKALGHDWSGEWTIIKEATATEEGKKETYCVRECGQKKVAVIPAEGEEDDDNGNIEKDAEVEPDAPVDEATIDNKKDDLLEGDIFTEEEKELIEAGEEARVWLEISKTDEDAITPDDKAKMEKEAANIMDDASKMTYFDADLFKQVGNRDKSEITEPGMGIKITIVIPKELLNADSAMVREYKILRLHEGKVDVISGTFDAATGEFSFETDKFSTYAIVYDDVPVDDADDKDDVPDTGVVSNSSYVVALTLMSGLGVFFCTSKKKVNK